MVLTAGPVSPRAPAGPEPPAGPWNHEYMIRRHRFSVLKVLHHVCHHVCATVEKPAFVTQSLLQWLDLCQALRLQVYLLLWAFEKYLHCSKPVAFNFYS